MNTAVTTRRTIRGERLPEDSGEWNAVKPVFRHLEARTHNPKALFRARMGIATIMAVGSHTLLLYLCIREVSLASLLVLVAPVPGTFLGLMWLRQFDELRREHAILASLLWPIGVIPAAAIISPEAIGAAFVLQIFWIYVTLFASIAAHKVLGGRP